LPGKARSRTEISDVPINQLRMLNEKPRQKLMYRALLPPKASTKVDSSVETQNTQKTSSKSVQSPETWRLMLTA
jgi:hypothetical protein